jgi:hypothetical protein
MVFSVSFVSGGSALSLLYQNYFKPNEFYFYFNIGLGKIQLIVVAALINIFWGVLLLNFINHNGKYI